MVTRSLPELPVAGSVVVVLDWPVGELSTRVDNSEVAKALTVADGLTSPLEHPAPRSSSAPVRNVRVRVDRPSMVTR